MCLNVKNSNDKQFKIEFREFRNSQNLGILGEFQEGKWKSEELLLERAVESENSNHLKYSLVDNALKH